MQLIELINIVNNIYYNNSTSYRTIESISMEVLSVMHSKTNIKHIDYKLINKYFEYIKTKNKPTTVNNKMMYISKLLTYAYKNKLIDYKPNIPTMKIELNKEVILTDDNIKAMLSYAKQNNLIELYNLLQIGLSTGMRVANILSITLDNIDNNYIRIYHNKTNKPYSIPLNDTLKELFKDFKPFKLNYRQIQYQFSTMVKELNLNPNITIHTLRHTVCTKLINNNIPIPVVQKIMNHKNINTTLRYTHIKDKELELAINML